ncbi:MAG: M48 family metallopeptidase [bacterium]
MNSPLEQNGSVLNIEGVGKVRLRRNHRAKHLNICIKPFRGILVTVPDGMKWTDAKKIVISKQNWILKKLKQTKSLEEASVNQIKAGVVYTHSHRVEIKAALRDNILLFKKQDQITIRFPAALGMEHLLVQKAVKKALINIYRFEAKNYLPARLNYWAKKFNLPYNKVTIRKQTSRWGSCSSKNNINLNLHLMRLPDRLIDYVLLHELVHTKIKNHGPAFWRKLTELCPNAKKLNKALNNYSLFF